MELIRSNNPSSTASGRSSWPVRHPSRFLVLHAGYLFSDSFNPMPILISASPSRRRSDIEITTPHHRRYGRGVPFSPCVNDILKTTTDSFWQCNQDTPRQTGDFPSAHPRKSSPDERRRPGSTTTVLRNSLLFIVFWRLV
jgi:hypothetical protein